MAASAPAPFSKSSPPPASSNTTNVTPADTTAPAAADVSPPLSSPPPPPAPAPPPLPAASPPTPLPPPKPAPSAPPPTSSLPPPPPPPKLSPSAPPPPTPLPAPPPTPTPTAPTPRNTPTAPPSTTPRPPTPAASPPARASPHAPSPPPAASHKPLPSPATAVDPANPHAGGTGRSRNKSSTQSPPGAASSSPPGNNGLGDTVVIAVGTVLAFLVITLLGAAVWYTKKRRRGRDEYRHARFMSPPSYASSSSRRPLGDTANAASSSTDPSTHTKYSAGSPRLQQCPSDISMDGNSRLFTYQEMYHITDGFSPRNLLGEGGFGSVYRGRLPEGKEVAVKQLRDGSGQGEREFQAEVETISRVHHRHLVSLVGYCISDSQRLLVYDFVSNDTLHYHLHGHGRPVLDWTTRVKVATGAAHGIAYLHEDCHPRIIHRDIKSSNILLDHNFDALVADFGLARLALDAVTHVTTRVMGTFGYMAPEYASSGKLTEKSDVFSFGVVLLELMTGRKPVDASRPLGNESLVEWARPLLTRALETGNLEELVDPRLEKNFNEVEMFRMIESAAACIRHSSSKRPRMSQVVRVLDSLADIDLTNGIQPGQSELFNVANTADIRMFQQMVQGNNNQDDSSGFSQYSLISRSRAGAEATSSNSRML